MHYKGRHRRITKACNHYLALHLQYKACNALRVFLVTSFVTRLVMLRCVCASSLYRSRALFVALCATQSHIPRLGLRLHAEPVDAEILQVGGIRIDEELARVARPSRWHLVASRPLCPRGRRRRRRRRKRALILDDPPSKAEPGGEESSGRTQCFFVAAFLLCVPCLTGPKA